MPGIVDHAAGLDESQVGRTRNSDLIPRLMRDSNNDLVNPPIKPKPMHAKGPSSGYVFTGLDSFIRDAADRAGFGKSDEEASLMARINSDWFVKQAANAISHASTLTDEAQVAMGVRRAKSMATILSLAATGIMLAISDRDRDRADAE